MKVHTKSWLPCGAPPWWRASALALKPPMAFDSAVVAHCVPVHLWTRRYAGKATCGPMCGCWYCFCT